MNRTKVMTAIVEQYQRFGPRGQEVTLLDALKHLNDTSLIAFAADLGINTDKLFKGGKS